MIRLDRALLFEEVEPGAVIQHLETDARALVVDQVGGDLAILAVGVKRGVDLEMAQDLKRKHFELFKVRNTKDWLVIHRSTANFNSLTENID